MMTYPKLTQTRWFAGAVLALSAAGVLAAQQLSPQVRTAYVKVDAPVIALTNARVIDGTGGPVRQAQTIVIRDGVIAAMGDAPGVTAPDGATIIDLAGKTVLPGFVMVHEHLYYPVGSGVYGQLGESFTRLYLAGGVTTMRTGGNVNGFMDLNMKLAIDRGQKPGPDHRRDGAVPERPQQFHSDAHDEGTGRRPPASGVLGGRRLHVVQGVHADHARGAGRGDRRSRTSAA